VIQSIESPGPDGARRDEARPSFVCVTAAVGNPVSSCGRPHHPNLASPIVMTQSTQPTELNLVTHRAPYSVWNRRGWDGTTDWATTRVLVGVGGGALAIEGLRRRGVTGSFFAAIGGSLAWWALTGEGDLSVAERWFHRVLQLAPWNRPDLVQQASDESFPASDAPSWTPTVGTSLRRSRASGASHGPERLERRPH
jgi:hypothetical protein